MFKKPHEVVSDWQKQHGIDFVSRSYGLYSTSTISHENLCELAKRSRSDVFTLAHALVDILDGVPDHDLAGMAGCDAVGARVAAARELARHICADHVASAFAGLCVAQRGGNSRIG